MLFFAASFVPAVHGQGLLGERYAEIGFAMSRPNDPIAREVNDWAYGIAVSTNLPVATYFDFNLRVFTQWHDGTIDISGTPVDFSTDFTALEGLVVGHANPYGVLDPFAGIGLGYGEIEQTAGVGAVNVSVDDDDVVLAWIAGVEWELSDYFTLRPQLSSGDSLDDFDLDEIVIDHLFFTTEFILRFNERVYTGLGIGSDFDNTDVRLEYFLGCGF